MWRLNVNSDQPDFRYSFAHTPYVRPRMEPVRAIVLHTTGGIRPPRGVFETLKARRLSVHYIVGSDGEVLQTAPHSLVCLHAGKVNAWSVGIECVSPLIPSTKAAQLERQRGVRRRVYTRPRARPARDRLARAHRCADGRNAAACRDAVRSATAAARRAD
jgi:N-acetyl-anhydromuramyl-L-alanine amidase AmpD